MFKKHFIIIFLSSALFAKNPATLLPVIKWQTPSNTPVWLVSRHSLPIIDVAIVYNAGSSQDGRLLGLASVTSSMLDQGVAGLSHQQIKEQFSAVGALFSTAFSRDYASVHLRSLSFVDNFNPAIALFAKIIKAPNFNNKRLQEIKKRHLLLLKSQQKQPSSLAVNAFFSNLYKNHPYANNKIGSYFSIKKIRRKNLVRFFNNHYNQAKASIIIVGDIDKNQAEQLALKLEKQLPKKTTNTVDLAVVPELKSNKTIKIPFDSKQTTLILGQAAAKISDQDLAALKIGNHILGGGMNSDLFNNIREKRGWAYMIYSQIMPLEKRGPFFVIMQTQQKEIDQVVVAIEKTLADFIKKGSSEEQIKAAKAQFLGHFYQAMASNSGTLSLLYSLAAYKRPADYLAKFIDKINHTTQADIKAAFSHVLHDNKQILVAVGPLQQQEI